MPDKYAVFYQLAEEYDWANFKIALLACLLTLLVVLGGFAYRKRFKAKNSAERILFPLILSLPFLFSILMAMVVYFTDYQVYLESTEALRSGRAPIVEGRVENYTGPSDANRGWEGFTVNGTRFSYASYCLTVGFRQTASVGGPIRPNRPVRITHWKGHILRLEVAAQ